MIVLQVIRALFILTLTAVGWSLVETGNLLPEHRPALFIGVITLSAAIITIDVLAPRKSLVAISGLFFGLIVGLTISYGLSQVIEYLRQVFFQEANVAIFNTTKLLLGVICCYLCVSFILQTKDDIRFVIPYVEFAKQVKGQRPLILDTSVIIDGRIADIAGTGLVDQTLIVPRFVLHELQAVADSSDRLKRNRGRRGLDILNGLQASEKVEVQIFDDNLTGPAAAEPVDQKLLSLAKTLNGRVVTNDYNLNKVAQVRGVTVINVNDIAKAVKPVVLPGECITVKMIRPGEEMHQGVGYLEDGTMVVVEGGRQHIGSVVDAVVTSALQTSAGRMIFGRVEGVPPAERHR